MLEHISIDRIRNLSSVSIDLHPGATALFGANGSGKTSFLEAIHVLGVGRSFRTHQAKPVIQHGQDECRVVCRVRQQARSFAMGIEKHRDSSVRARIDGANVASLSELARAMPLVLLDTDSLGWLLARPKGAAAAGWHFVPRGTLFFALMAALRASDAAEKRRAAPWYT